jgi:hypothetical protein
MIDNLGSNIFNIAVILEHCRHAWYCGDDPSTHPLSVELLAALVACLRWAKHQRVGGRMVISHGD